MITAGIIRNGANYLSHHLKKNDYWAEGEKEVNGEWIGEAARALGLSGSVTEEAFDALRRNRHPTTGKALTSIDGNRKVAFVDIQLSAPKDVSVLAMVGGDDRVRTAFVESVKITLIEMERFAAVRERRGNANLSEQYRLTGNYAGGLFIHDASRDLDPQLHAHAVLANLTWDPARNSWFALQPAEMLRASGYLRQVLYRELSSRLRGLGYERRKSQRRSCAWWRPRSGTTLTRAKIGKPAAGSCWKNSAEGRVGSIGRGDLGGAATTGSPEARPWLGVLGAKKGPKPLASHEACKAEGEVASARGIHLGPAEDDVVGDLDTEDATGFAQLARDADIGA